MARSKSTRRIARPIVEHPEVMERPLNVPLSVLHAQRVAVDEHEAKRLVDID